MTTGKRMPDGTICWTGPACRKHGHFFTKNIFRKVRLSTKNNPTSKQTARQAEETLELNQIYGQLYNYLMKTAPPVFENEEHKPETSTRQGLNGTDKTKINQLNLEALQVRMEITDEEKQTLTHYQSSYEFVNAYLREGETGINKLGYLRRTSPHPTKPDSVSEETLEKYVEMAKSRIAGLDSVLKQHARKAKNTQILYRAFFLTTDAGTYHQTPQQYAKENYRIGQIIEEKSYLSTSNDSDYMLKYNPHLYDKQIVFEIKTNKGLVLHNPAETIGSIGAEERETLLPRGMKYKVTNITEATYKTTYSNEATEKARKRNSHLEEQKTFTVIQLEEIDETISPN